MLVTGRSDDKEAFNGGRFTRCQAQSRLFALGAATGMLLLAACAQAAGERLEVGPNKELKTLSAASMVAKDGDLIEVEAGDYVADVATWKQNEIVIRARNGRVRLVASGAAAEAKAIWVVRGGKLTVEGFDFVGAKVKDKNGAGIRLEKGRLSVVDCGFFDNENGILTGGDAESTLEIQNSEFGNNGHGDGQSHNLYVGAIAMLKVTGSYFHHARVGHLLKSRAAQNLIYYNRLTDETGGRASYELEFPAGGLAYVVGNIIQQSSSTENPHIISFGVEGYRHPENRLYLVNNTLVDLRPKGGIFLRVKPGADVFAMNNLLLGSGSLDKAGPGEYKNNFNVDFDEFVRVLREDYRLRPSSALIGKAMAVNVAGGIGLTPLAEYQHPRSIRRLQGGARNPGAIQQ
ncbi:hypothetical protein [Dechloromonas agitata]|uniref:hypothetical protein n=1 Tax=Dechloromonas agitata TaxID=73030 RepID=UPI0004B271C4|nr:hypothetical protein [Dechloromonas agitata]